MRLCSMRSRNRGHEASLKIILLCSMMCVAFVGTSFTPFHTANAVASCVSYDSATNTIFITCDAHFADVKRQIPGSSVLKSQGTGNYILNAKIIVNDGATFSMSSSELKWFEDFRPKLHYCIWKDNI